VKPGAVGQVLNFLGTATQLAKALRRFGHESESPRALSAGLRRIAPSLRSGYRITVKFLPRTETSGEGANLRPKAIDEVGRRPARPVTDGHLPRQQRARHGRPWPDSDIQGELSQLPGRKLYQPPQPIRD